MNATSEADTLPAGGAFMSRLLGLMARAWRALTAPVELDDTDRAW
jgi:hypothetical protein